jgi:hypothetical protein
MRVPEAPVKDKIVIVSLATALGKINAKASRPARNFFIVFSKNFDLCCW